MLLFEFVAGTFGLIFELCVETTELAKKYHLK